MKKTLVYVGAALAVLFSLNSCNKEIQDPEEGNVIKKGSPFEIVANPVETRTENDGMSTKWAEDDAINVFHAVAGTTTYVSDDDFTIDASGLSSNTFKGTVSEALTEDAYDWYMFYPYSEYITTPANTETGYTAVGSMKSRTQTQNENNSMAHLAGETYPLYGVVKNLANSETPSVAVNQVCSFLEITVTNNGNVPLSVNKVIFKAPEDIIGTYYIDFTDPDNLVFTPSIYQNNPAVTETAVLTVQNGAAIAVGSSAKFYLGIKPFSAAAGDQIDVTVNDYKKTITLDKTTAFASGKIKKVKFSYDKQAYVFAPAEFELASDIAAGDKVIITNGTSGDVVVMKHYVSGNNYKQVAATINSGIITSTEDMAVLTVEGSSGNWNFFDEANSFYLNATSTTSANYLKTSSEVDDFAKWSVVFNSDGSAKIKCTGKNSRDIIFHNSSSSLFSCYNSTSTDGKPVYIFKITAPKVLQSITLSGSFKTEFMVGDTFDYEGLIVTATFDDASTAIVSPTSVSTPDMSTTGTKEVTVSYTYKDVTKTAKYSVTITARPTFTVTLGDDNTALTEASGGAGVTLPTRDNVGNYTFVGWCETNIVTATQTAPTIISAGLYNPSANITLYPVYLSSTNATIWKKTALSAVTAGNYVLLTENYYAFNGTIANGHGGVTDNAMTFDSEDNATEIPSGAIILQFIASGSDGFKMYNEGYGYLYAKGKTSGNLDWHMTENSYWSYASSNWTYKSASAFLRSYNDSSFRTYGQNNGKVLVLAKETTSTINTYTSNPE